MEVFSKGVVVTVTLFPLCCGQCSEDGDHHAETTQPTRRSPPSAYLEDELHHLSVDQTMNRLSVDVGDEVTSAQTGLLGRAAILHVLPDHRKQPRGTQLNTSDKDFTSEEANLPRFGWFLPKRCGARCICRCRRCRP